jgi:uncharacterized protein
LDFNQLIRDRNRDTRNHCTQPLLYYPLFLTFADPEHFLQEQRFILGKSAKRRLLIVAYTDRAGTTRLISARPVTRKERKAYESDL